MIEINGKNYYININKVFEIVEYSDKTEKREQEITDGYELVEVSGKNGKPTGEQKLSPISKLVREIKGPADSQIDNLRYDFLKMLIASVISYEEEAIDFGTAICINSLVNSGILVEIENNDN